MNIFEIYKTGGFYMNIISLLAVATIIVTVMKVTLIVKKKDINPKLLGLILMSGSVALAVGMLSQMVGIIQALEEIRAASDISPQIVMSGAIVSFYAPVWGFIVFIFSALFYFILKEIIRAKN